MTENIQTTLLEYEKSTFFLDLSKHESGKLYISIQQTIHIEEGVFQTQKIKINPDILPDIIEALNHYKSLIPKSNKSTLNYFSIERMGEIVKRYLRGNVEISDLALQFDCNKKIIEQILNNNNVAIVSNKLPPKSAYKKRK